MPTVARIGPFRLFFYSADGVEPAHIHVERDDAIAKYWLGPVRYARSRGFKAADLRDIERLVVQEEITLLEAWNEYFGA